MILVMILHMPMMMIWWSFAKLQYREHTQTCHYHYHCNHGLSDKCSLCSRHHQLRSSLSNTHTERQEPTATLMLALLKQILKCAQIFVPVLLILLCGDVETNPGPGEFSLAY